MWRVFSYIGKLIIKDFFKLWPEIECRANQNFERITIVYEFRVLIIQELCNFGTDLEIYIYLGNVSKDGCRDFQLPELSCPADTVKLAVQSNSHWLLENKLKHFI